MRFLSRLLASVGLIPQPSEPEETRLYVAKMHEALERIRVAELQMREATSLEELDVGRSALKAAQAELVQLIRTVKRERGVAVRPVAECEEAHRQILDNLSAQARGQRPPNQPDSTLA